MKYLIIIIFSLGLVNCSKAQVDLEYRQCTEACEKPYLQCFKVIGKNCRTDCLDRCYSEYINIPAPQDPFKEKK